MPAKSLVRQRDIDVGPSGLWRVPLRSEFGAGTG